ncbi:MULTISPECIES: MBL fold metallo-hydrolase [Pseudonocardia]|uniref:MBL fold metallo-hydrolase n=2 Tax=Pseudonocardia TaxID=1847 RepID=A0ABQ0RQY0_9PSEU|nr:MULTISPECIES: MBL fold metallo-hydrolase [Pseudonocardia]OSY39156.1 putative polyketide biosynthesis zinc-dependent hydrolase BaeB [Pseudonocardia autotrophica]TDN71249.1 glyoxylase-like metal-dependent hydrolase (beta-lactamase superfamily II) [Pseudonocardia autotrophica]BBG01921.1 MBL fold metallo-hydrolase [Pseudonocardia autotrophica]GEC23085.1 MBL fold metallo-hydrolase [Pseudonocardia saturnea]
MGLYFRQLLSGQDYAVGDPVATQMVNFSYLIGDRESGEAVVVDPAYSPDELLSTLDADGMRLTGVLATHHHPDHVGGSMMGFDLVGLAELLGKHPVPVHVQRAEADYVTRVTGLSATDLTPHDHDDVLEIGALRIRLLHTPGHTPGSQCFLVQDPDGDKLVAGDTLFLQGCGRTDFPGGDAAQMYHSLQQLASLKGNPTVYPGHRYTDAPSAALEDVQRTNMVYRATSAEQFVSAFGG